jgi:hypothetical protein
MPAPILVDLKFNSETVARILKTVFADRGSINLADPANKGRDLTGLDYALLWKPDAHLFERAPDLKVIFSLPKELEFVSGSGNGGVQVTGSGQSASTNVFVLAPPNGRLHVELKVRVIGKPPGELVKARASIQTATGVELSGEYSGMTEEPRSGALLPEHLVAQQNLNGEEA